MLQKTLGNEGVVECERVTLEVLMGGDGGKKIGASELSKARRVE
jgi:hypothetical protein